MYHERVSSGHRWSGISSAVGPVSHSALFLDGWPTVVLGSTVNNAYGALSPWDKCQVVRGSHVPPGSGLLCLDSLSTSAATSPEESPRARLLSSRHSFCLSAAGCIACGESPSTQQPSLLSPSDLFQQFVDSHQKASPPRSFGCWLERTPTSASANPSLTLAAWRLALLRHGGLATFSWKLSETEKSC
ncbi:hypothetical protein ASPZODRAFT_17821 [Penicilliopsis zonata CBS 506.65]|uniref:Uncharacterized protein n=1 Tax=Penicilliopsis zonata CBS 506.65 TaxID=1073090 RepID=A0A1L9SCQ8_9EURO|nr:hypothetical protein ASPZODRAFT_17821 [Penicilliopsis zonata CBS 506.65]OJJ44908.1 hypothetical protein ASPZODRAFT_17821 [Penicilliopsis zonata CBS 506.65]